MSLKFSLLSSYHNDLNPTATLAIIVFLIDLLLLILLLILRQKSKYAKDYEPISVLEKRTFSPLLYYSLSAANMQDQAKKSLWMSNNISKAKFSNTLKKSMAYRTHIDTLVTRNGYRDSKILYKSLCACKRLKGLKVSLFPSEGQFKKNQARFLERSIVKVKHITTFELDSKVNTDTVLLKAFQQMKQISTLRLHMQDLGTDTKNIERLGQAVLRLSNLKSLQVYFAGLTKEIDTVELNSFGRSLLHLNQLAQLKLSFASCIWMTDEEMIGLCREIFLLRQLTQLQLDLAYCTKLTDKTLCWIGEHLPQLPNLKKLQLYFLDIVSKQSQGTTRLWSGISNLPTLRLLQVDSYNHLAVESRALVPISEGLSKLQNLEELYLYFGTSFKLDSSDLGLLGSAISSLQNLVDLDLEFINFPISDDGLIALAGSVLSLKLKNFKLNLTGCKGITDEGIIQVSKGFANQTELSYFSLDILCSTITTYGFMTLARNIGGIESLKVLDLEFTDFNQITDFGIISLGESLLLLPHLEQLNLYFEKSSGFNDVALIMLSNYISKMKTLNNLTLFLENIPISDQGIITSTKIISKTPQLTKVKIKVFKCFITIKGRAAIKACEGYIQSKRR